jgi:hypothetical protein
MKKRMVSSVIFAGIFLAAISCFALTPQQVMELKKAGVSDKTIQLMIQQEEAAKDPAATMGVKEVKDKDGNTVTIYTTGKSTVGAADDEEAKKVENAWEMLRNIVIDKTKDKKERTDQKKLL